MSENLIIISQDFSCGPGRRKAISPLPVFLLAILSLALTAGSQPYGLTARPPARAFMGGLLPNNSPLVSNGWTAQIAFTNLTFTNAVGLCPVPGTSNLCVWEREGRVYTFTNSPGATVKRLVLDVSDRCQGWDDSGLLGVAFHPGFSSNRYVFVWYSCVAPGAVIGSPTTRPPLYTANTNRLSRFTLDTNGVAIPGSELILISQAATCVWHKGGGMFFHPTNGFLYLSVGFDNNAANCQRIDKDLFSGVFRIDVDQRGGSISHPIPRQPDNGTTANYYIPNDNPFVGQTNVLEEFFALGLRSPHRMTYDPVSDRIFIGDVGQDNREEVDVINSGDPAGLNFQWNVIEGLNGDLVPPYIGTNRRPIIDYAHDGQSSAVIGGYVYRGSEFAAQLGGRYIFGDNVRRTVWMLDETVNPPAMIQLCVLPKGSGPNSGADYTGLSSFGVDHNNELYLCQMSSQGGYIYKLAQTGGSAGGVMPALLSQTGVFTNMQTLGTDPGLVPYNVNSPLWSDGADKWRWMGIPTNTTIGFSPTGEWSFPTGSVFVKHFELPVDDANPAIRRRLETRLLVLDNLGGAYGATYKWRADFSDADIVTNALLEPIAITNGVLVRTQQWLYPSRAQCIACHTTASGYVLGIKTRQLNGSCTYPSTGVTDNQLRALNNVGMFSPPINEAAITNYDRLVSVTNTSATLEHRVRSYLDANCANCHRPGGAPALWDARFDTALTNQSIINGAVVNNLGIMGARVVVPQQTGKSILHLRVQTNNSPLVMPPLGRTITDTNAVTTLEAWIASLAVSTNGLPAPWTNQDVGTVGIAGSASETSGAFTLTATGDDIWNNADAFHYAFQPLVGDGEIRARVVSLDPVDPWSKAGVMIRESLSADSKHAFALVSAGNGVDLQYRINTGGSSGFSSQRPATAPYWVRLVRAGQTFVGYSSPDGTNWTSWPSITVAMSNTVNVGLALVSHSNAIPGTAVFDNVQILNIGVFSNPPLASVTNPPGGVGSYVSDLSWTSSANGWGPVERDMSNGSNGSGDGGPIILGGERYLKGLGAHAPSEVRIPLGGQYSSFLTDIGMDPVNGVGGSVSFQVWADDQLLFSSSNFTASSTPQSVRVSVAGRNELRLVVTDAGDGNFADHALWAGARLFSPGTNVSLGAFSTPTGYSTATHAHGVVLADFDGDGKLDAVVANAGSGSVSFLRGNSNGTFQAAVNYSVGSEPKQVAAGDINGDGKLDILSAEQGSSTVSVLLGNGDGTFQPSVQYPAVTGAHEAAFADVNGDGRPDVVVVGWGENNAGVLIANTNGTLQTVVKYPIGAAPTSIVPGDFNGDGKIDLAVANNGTNTVGILFGAGDGSFSNVVLRVVGPGPHSIRAGDLNGDGKLDLVTANEGNNTVGVLLGVGDGSFLAATNFSSGPVPKGVCIADINGDGKPDLLTANTAGNYPTGNNPGGDTFSVLLGNGDGTFGAFTNYSTGNTPFCVVTADLDGDGDLDVVTANWHANNITVVRNNRIAPSNVIQPGTRFVMDGQLDAGVATLIASGPGLYAAVQGGTLYVATLSPGYNGTNDHFIIVSDQLLGASTNPAPAGKLGNVAVPAGKPVLVGHGGSDFFGWYNVPGTWQASKSLTNGGYLEGSIDLASVFGSIPSTLYLAVAGYDLGSNGLLVAQSPPGNADTNLDSGEFFALSLGAATLGATNISSSGATLSGAANPNGLTSTAYFQWGIGTNYGNIAGLTNLIGSNVVSLNAELSGLVSGTTYRYRLVLSNANGTFYGLEQVFTTLVPAPTVVTLVATNIGAFSATLQGQVNPNGAATGAYFEWGDSTAYGNIGPVSLVGSGTNALSLDFLAGGLPPGSTIHFRLVATNAGGFGFGVDQTLVTTVLPPDVETLAATNTGAFSSALRLALNPQGLPAAAFFEWGTTTNYGSVSETNHVGAGTNTVLLTNLLSGLSPGVGYHFRAVASNTAGVVYGSNQHFTTLVIPPVVIALPATNLSDFAAELAGFVNPNGLPTTAYFEWGTTTNFGSTTAVLLAGSGTNGIPFTAVIGGLAPGGTYYYRLAASNSAGLVRSAGLAFTTTVSPPAVTTLAATNVSAFAASLNASVNPNGVSSAAYFQWGTTTNYGDATAATSVGNGTNTAAFTSALSGLAPSTLYHFRVVATNAAGTNWGLNQSFTTAPNTAPFIGFVSNLVAAVSTAVGPVGFTIGDAETLPAALSVTAVSANTNLVPLAGIALGGAGSSRSITLTPVAGQRGHVAITITVSDGLAATSRSFVLSVGVIPGDLNFDGVIDLNELNNVLQYYRGLVPPPGP